MKQNITKNRFGWSGASWNDWVIMTFLLFTPANKRWLRWKKKKRKSPRGPRRLILWHLLYSDTSLLSWVTCYQWHSVEQLFWMLWTQRHSLYKRGWFYSVGITENICKNLESLSFTNLWLEKICQTLFLSLWGNKTQSTLSKMGELTASLSLAERRSTTEIWRQLNSVPDEFPDPKCPTSFYKVLFFFF